MITYKLNHEYISDTGRRYIIKKFTSYVQVYSIINGKEIAIFRVDKNAPLKEAKNEFNVYQYYGTDTAVIRFLTRAGVDLKANNND